MSTSPRSSTFDPSSVSRGTWVAGGGALVLFISVFLSWYKADLGVLSVSRSGWDSTDVAKLVALLALLGLAAIAIELFAQNVTLPVPESLLLLGLGGLSILLVLLKIIDKPFGDGVGLAWGIWVSLIAAIVMTVGGYLKMQES